MGILEISTRLLTWWMVATVIRFSSVVERRMAAITRFAAEVPSPVVGSYHSVKERNKDESAFRISTQQNSVQISNYKSRTSKKRIFGNITSCTAIVTRLRTCLGTPSPSFSTPIT